MSELLNSGRIGVLGKDKNSNNHIHDRWKNSGLLDGLDVELETKVALSLEIAANFMIMEEKMNDMYFKDTGNIVEDDDSRFDTIIFVIIRRTISKFPDAHKYVPEIINMTKKEYDTFLCKSIYSGNEKAMVYFYDKVLPKWSIYHKERKHKTYYEFKKYAYKKHKERGNKNYPTPPFEEFVPMDWEEEFCCCVADKITKIIEEHVKNKEDGTNKI